MKKLLANRKLLLGLLALVVLGGFLALSRHKKEPPKKVTGTIYVMPQSFLLNLDEGHYAKLSVALDLAPQQSDGSGEGAAAAPSSGEGAGTLPEEALVREIVVNAVTGQSGSTLVSSSGRRAIRKRILQAIEHETDLKVQSVLFPEITVQ